MDVPKTLENKPCKLCLEKRERGKDECCHLHGGSSRKHSKKWREEYKKAEEKFQKDWRKQHGHSTQWYTPLQKEIPFISYNEWLEQHKYSSSPKSPISPKSPKKTRTKSIPRSIPMSPKKKTEQEQFDEMLGTFLPQSPTEFHSFLDLPKPALYQVLLNMNPVELEKISKIPEISKIISLREFKRLYNIKHQVSKLTLGKGAIVQNARKKVLVIEGENGYSVEILCKNSGDFFTVKIEIKYNNIRNYINFSFEIFNTEGEVTDMDFAIDTKDYGLRRWSSPGNQWGLTQTIMDEKDKNRYMDQINHFFSVKGSPHWILNKKRGEITFDNNLPREIYEIAKNELNKYKYECDGLNNVIMWPTLPM